MKYDFIEIGTAYFDTELQKNDERIGLSIDLIQEYLDMLPNNPNVTKICCAISDKFGEYIVYKPNFPSNFPEWLSGCVSVLIPHKHVIDFCVNNNINYNDYITTRTVNAIPVSELINKYNITSVDYLKIDTEGHDVIILNNWLDFCENNNNLYPKRIFFESKDLTDKNELNKINERLIKLNYKLTFYLYDTEAILQE
jgi:FkbM family methyltransferase